MAHRWNVIALLLLLAGIAVWYRGSTPKKDPVPSTTTSPPAPASTPSAPPSPETLEKPEPSPVAVLEMRDGSLPNLTLVDVIFDEPYIKVLYANNAANGEAADFTIALSANGRTFDGNSNYRNVMPEAGVICTTGGFTPGLVGLEPSMPTELLVTIDPDDRVRELDESDNTMRCRVDIGPGTVEKLDTPPQNSPPDSGRIDLITTNAQLDEGKLTLTLANQGDEGSGATFTLAVLKDGREIHSMSNLGAPPPRGSALLMDLPLTDLRPGDLVEIRLDVNDEIQEAREGNNSYLRQLDNSHDLGE